MSSVTNLTELNINYLTQDQYDTALANNEINENEIYFTPSTNSEIIDLIYPVGSIYMSVNNVSPGTFLPGTTWEQIQDKFLLAAGTTYAGGRDGGHASVDYTPQGSVNSHTLTLNEIPSHRHQENTNNFAWKANSSILQKGTSWNASTSQTLYTGYAGGGKGHTHGFTGTQATIETMPPYLTVYMWKRTA